MSENQETEKTKVSPEFVASVELEATKKKLTETSTKLAEKEAESKKRKKKEDARTSILSLVTASSTIAELRHLIEKKALPLTIPNVTADRLDKTFFFIVLLGEEKLYDIEAEGVYNPEDKQKQFPKNYKITKVTECKLIRDEKERERLLKELETVSKPTETAA